MLVAVKSVGASLNVKCTVAVLAARLTSVLSTVTDAVGVTVSTVKAVLVAPVPGLPAASCQVLSTLTDPVAMSVAAAAVLVAVKSVGASLNVECTVAVSAARLTSVLSTVTDAVGVTVSTVKAVLVAPVPGLPAASCQVLSTLTDPVAMSVAA